MIKRFAVALFAILLPLAAHAGYWLSPTQGYYEGDKQSAADQAVSRRPDSTYDWSGSDWVANAARSAPLIYNAAMVSGLGITSTGTPALNGTYAVDAVAQAKLNAVSTYIAINGKFPRGATSLTWFDLAGTPHTFTTTTSFQAFASALADYVTGLEETKDLLLAGQSASWPSATATIP